MHIIAGIIPGLIALSLIFIGGEFVDQYVTLRFRNRDLGIFMRVLFIIVEIAGISAGEPCYFSRHTHISLLLLVCCTLVFPLAILALSLLTTTATFAASRLAGKLHDYEEKMRVKRGDSN